MGKSKHIKQILELFDKSPVVDLRSIERIIGVKKQDNNYAKLLVSNLVIQGKIKKIIKGKYSKYDDHSLSVMCFNPAYLGLQSALSFHGLWDQASVPVIITSVKVRSGTRDIFGSNVMIRRTDKKFMFGFEYVLDGDFYLPYSGIEKTFIDMVVFKQNISDDVLMNFRKRINKKKLVKYLTAYSKKTRDLIMKLYIGK
ncbi:TPA: hypothetical protein HA235_04050 [Candidatus Woesearchaeota archaeon]|nr:hypothetical protein [uncultured archaeon]MBS3173054.1 hypothetical protein [Candidatus Woesearchaeota archaeon]AQS32962.1 hypothetical protein [uncultured archaeon]HIH31856.1 hypothetical protein [Candidatus Woesearchaeota archaeon]HIH54393.1 hypothetical protein [Candidatus Woesearchaeota archaeon]